MTPHTKKPSIRAGVFFALLGVAFLFVLRLIARPYAVLM